MRLALYQPDIPQNTGAIMRMAACLGIELDVIEPCGFIFSDVKLKRVGLDYLDKTRVTRHQSWKNFLEHHTDKRLVLSTTKTSQLITNFEFKADDVLIMGTESSGVPNEIHCTVGASVRVPMCEGTRSLNVAICASMIVWEASRQTGFDERLR